MLLSSACSPSGKVGAANCARFERARHRDCANYRTCNTCVESIGQSGSQRLVGISSSKNKRVYPIVQCESGDMAISIRLATTGEVLFTEAYDPFDDLRVWELRLRFHQKVKTTAFFSWILFHDQVLADDAALVSAYLDDPPAASFLFHAVVRELRPPTFFLFCSKRCTASSPVA